ncbi:ABC transporter substrate-binding protein [Roseomonas sp. M0104]|uniref:ABC transporter substrate-binding protein n=1 Tax=Teichococcus coralli TaxID=2545983 RepID=A0A845BC50_9PROT|nr:ABC transporter substrate-binding protein [Pseudoroseomonas coralli]MXP64721.1 ABC transporter substrate-binding protein [Pseudoroseomonas coralli]
MRPFIIGFACCALSVAAHAQKTLTIAAQSEPTAMDPHFHRANSNNAMLRQVFDPLVDFDNSGKIVPRLAESWRIVDDLTWEFRLREGVRFHDGTPLRPEDVAFSFARLPNVPNSPGSFASAVRTVSEVKIVDGRTLRITTSEPTPFLDAELTSVLILSRQLHQNATTADFNSGRAMIGTGAYRHVSYQQGNQLSVERNPAFWGGTVPWDKVQIRFVSNAGSRVAALTAGDVDLIDAVPTQDVARLEADPRMAVFGTESNGTAYLFPDSARERAPFVTDNEGRPLVPNPLRDVRVRRAISMAINRQGIVDRLLAGQGTPAEQFAPPIAIGRIPDQPSIPHDLSRARALLAEAGYPQGFRMSIHGPTGWFPGDTDVLQAVAQGMNRIGIEARVEVLPTSSFFSRATNRDFAMFMTTYASNLAAITLQQVVATRNPAERMGPFNRQHYSNPELDSALEQALRTMDPERRDALTAQAMRAAIDDVAVIPILYLKVNWAGLRDRVRYEPSPSWYTNALFATPVK